MHEGHRARLISRMTGGAKLYEHEYLEVLLFFACPRRDVNKVAHSLLDAFGSIRGVLSAEEEQLVKVPGVGVNIARYLRVIGGCGTGAKCGSFACITSTALFKKFLIARDPACGLELYMLDGDNRVRRIWPYDGALSPFPYRSVMAAVAAYRPYGIFAAHTVRGDCLPTLQDDETAGGLRDVCALSGVRLFDYCIKGSDGIYSYFADDKIIGRGGGV